MYLLFVCCINGSANLVVGVIFGNDAVRSSSAWVMLLSKNKLSARASSRRVRRMCALRHCLLVFFVGGATVMSSSFCGGSGLS